MAETPVTASLIMDRSEPLGNSQDSDLRRALHTKIKNLASEPITVTQSPFAIPATATVYTYMTGVVDMYFTEVYRFYSGGTPVAPVGLLKTITIYYSDVQRTIEVGGFVV